MRKLAAKFAGIVALAITLFFLGPQLGSLDIDGDGTPDVPIVVMLGNNDQTVQPTNSERPARSVFAIASPFSQLSCSDLGLMKVRIPAALRSAGLDCIPPLRC